MLIIRKSAICVCLLIGLSEINFLKILVRCFVKSESRLVPRIFQICRFIQKQLKFELRKKKKKTSRKVVTAKNYLSKT